METTDQIEAKIDTVVKEITEKENNLQVVKDQIHVLEKRILELRGEKLTKDTEKAELEYISRQAMLTIKRLYDEKKTLERAYFRANRAGL